MKRLILVFFLFFGFFSFGQTYLHLDTISSKSEEQLTVKKIAGDSLTSSFLIVIKQGVKKHFHKEHSETIYVLEGEGQMLLGEKTFQIKSGNYLFIPKNTPHKVEVTSKVPLKVLSIQAPFFDGKDRIVLE